MEHEAHAIFHLFGLEVTSVVTTMWGVMAVIIILSFLATRNLQKVPSGVQNLMEYVLQTLLDFLSGVMGEKRAKHFLPFLATIFLFILLSNYSGLLPMSGHITGLAAPSANISVTAGLALIVFFATHYAGIRKRGLGYFKHFVQPMPAMLPLNIVEEFVKPLSLSLRLYGNIFGEEMVAAILFSMIPMFLPLPMQFLGVLMGLIQAAVFMLLAAVYLASATADHH